MTRIEIGIALTRLVADWAAGTVTDVPSALRGLASDIDGEGQLSLAGEPDSKPASVALGPIINDIFNHWRIATRRDARSRLTPERTTAVRARLKQGWNDGRLSEG